MTFTVDGKQYVAILVGLGGAWDKWFIDSTPELKKIDGIDALRVRTPDLLGKHGGPSTRSGPLFDKGGKHGTEPHSRRRQACCS